MGDALDPSVRDMLAAARAEFGGRLLSKVDELDSLVARGEWDEARRAAHKLRGSASTYGFPEVGAAAAAAEEVLIQAAGAPDDTARARLADALMTARTEAERAAPKLA
jgi:HPt (histidine-containing phosphotransfer) domain-containing protein